MHSFHIKKNDEVVVLAGSAKGKRGRVIAVEGKGFLWHMVRIMVGTLVDIGLGHFKPDDVPAMIAARDRRTAGGTAPPHGLYLHWIKHLPIDQLPRPLEPEQPHTTTTLGQRPSGTQGAHGLEWSDCRQPTAPARSAN